ncbi:Highly reducing polyketide synthase virA [Paramyrothecium foliicola]|nr:Highly reducing polyketide synthase virA [Paramyrothecium foliicola]
MSIPESVLNGPALPPPDGKLEFDVETPMQTVGYVTAILCLVVGSLFFAARVAVRWQVWRSPDLVDIFSILLYPLFVGYMVMLLWLVGDGQFCIHQYNIRLKDLSRFFWIQFRGTNIWLAAMGIVKSAILLEWIRILCPRRQRDYFYWSCWVLIMVNLLFYGSLLIAFNLGCHPYARNWDKLIPGTCVDVRATDTSAGAINMVTDVLTLLLPMRTIWKLNMPTSKKLSVTGVFAVGILACVAAAFRLAASIRFYTSADATYTFSINSLWGTAEITCGLIILCAPAVPKLLQSAGMVKSWWTRKTSKPSNGSDSWPRQTADTSDSALRSYRRLNDVGVALTDFKAKEASESVEQLNQPQNAGGGILRTTDFTATENSSDQIVHPNEEYRHHPWVETQNRKAERSVNFPKSFTSFVLLWYDNEGQQLTAEIFARFVTLNICERLGYRNSNSAMEASVIANVQDFPEVNYDDRLLERQDIAALITSKNVGFSPGVTLSFPRTSQFNQSTERWNPAVPPSFVASISAATEEDVVKAVRLARSLNMPFMATGTRHGYGTTLGKIQGGIAIDLSGLTAIQVNKDRRTVTIGPGTTHDALIGPVDAAGFQLATGSCSCVSVVGVTAGGGVGRWSGVYGLVMDGLLSVRLVTHDGTIVEASESKNSDLFWGIRGAAANFGIITSATYTMRPRTNGGQALNADVLFPTDQAPAYFNMLQSIFANQPAELSVTTFILFDGGTGLNMPLLGANWVWHGSEATGSKIFEPLLALNPLVSVVTPMRWTDVTKKAAFGSDAGSCQKGTPRAIYSLNIRQLDIASHLRMVDKMVNFFNTTPAGRGSVFISEQFPNQATLAVPDSKTAYPWRDAKANIMIQMAWPIGDVATRAAAQDVGKNIRKDLAAASGYDGLSVYVNYAFGDEKLEEIYGAKKLSKLAQLKKKWDPSNFGLLTFSQRYYESSIKASLRSEIQNSVTTFVFGHGSARPISNRGRPRVYCCRLPGGIRSASDLWEFLLQKKSAQGQVPASRFNIDAYYHPDGNRAGVMNANGGYFIEEDVRDFENSFFDINNLEATHMDPQQRKLLEVIYECFENAGVTLDQVSGQNIGVYVGNFTVDYQTMMARDPDYLHRYTATGSGTAILANRVSHVFNLQGPSFVLDTGCSSSLFCLHTAVNAIKNGDCDSAIIAGANLITSPEQQLGTMKAGVLSPNSTCRTFDAAADGYGRADGINAIYVKRLSHAIRGNNKVWAIIRGSAINANGRTPGITQPSASAQEAVIRKAYLDAGLNFSDTDYVECHGTGTAIGDPIEVNALGNCFHPRTSSVLRIGSVKTNLGHSEAASGLTSIIKVAVAFDRGQIPPTRGVKKLNPKLNLEAYNMMVVTEVDDWPRTLQRASINSFGYGGANAHVILESIDSYFHKVHFKSNGVGEPLKQKLFVLPLSSFSPPSLETQLESITKHIGQCDLKGLKSLSYTLANRRTTFKQRHFLLARGYYDAPSELLGTDSPQPRHNAPVAFVFTGQGAQYPGMGKELLEENDLFAGVIRTLDEILKNLPSDQKPEWTIEETITEAPDTSQINDVTRSQPVCTAIQIALVEVLRSWGITPTSVVGHSSGEIAAAYAAGLITMPQAILTAYFRGFAAGKLQTRGSMLAAGITTIFAGDLINELGLGLNVCVACVNAPEVVTLSGATECILKIHEKLQEQKRFSRLLNTGGKAYHSHMMQEIGQLYQDLIEPFFAFQSENKNTGVQMYSSCGDSPADLSILDNQTCFPEYWRNNLEKPVQFHSAASTLLMNNDIHLVEIGPHSALKSPLQQIHTASSTTSKTNFLYSPTLVRAKDSSVCLGQLAGTLFIHGHNLDWDKVNNLPARHQKLFPNLPPYFWDYSGGSLWFEPRPSADIRGRKYRRHELLGAQQVADNGVDFRWRNVLRLSEAPWIRDHKLEASIVFPAAGYLCMVMEAWRQIQTVGASDILPQPLFTFRNVDIGKALVIDDDDNPTAKEVEIHTSMGFSKISKATASSEWYDFSISSWSTGQVAVHCSGSVRVDYASTRCEPAVIVDNTDNYETWPITRWYKKFDEKGLCFGPFFQSVKHLSTEVERKRHETISAVDLRPGFAQDTDMYYSMHPITIDACLQAAIMGIPAGNIHSLRAFVPIFITECQIQAIAPTTINQECEIHSRSHETGLFTERIDCTLKNAEGTPLINFKNVRLAQYIGKDVQNLTKNTNRHEERHPCLRISWNPDISMLGQDNMNCLGRLISSLKQHTPDMDDSISVVARFLRLFSHKNPRTRVLALDGWYRNEEQYLKELLGEGTAFPHYRQWTSMKHDELIATSPSHQYDVLLTPKTSWTAVNSNALISQIPESGLLISERCSESNSILDNSSFTALYVSDDLIITIRKQQLPTTNYKTIVIVTHTPSDSTSNFISALQTFLVKRMNTTKVHVASLCDLADFRLTSDMACVSLLEIECQFLATMSQEQMHLLRRITNSVGHVLWLTGANMLGLSDANLTLSSGLSRALMMEQPSLRFSILDLGRLSDVGHGTPLNTTCHNIVRVLMAQHALDDKEFIQSEGIIHVSRFTPDLDMNEIFRQRLVPTEPLPKKTLATTGLSRVSIGRAGVTDTIHFQQINNVPETLPADHVEVSLKSVSLNAKDIYAMGARVETRAATVALEFAGVVTAVGSLVKDFQPGDRVAAWAPNQFTTVERVPAWAVHKLLPNEDFTIVPTLLTTYATALYALLELARLRKGESVLIHAGAGGLGTAAIAIAKRTGAIVYVTASSVRKREYLVQELGLPPSHVFQSRDLSFREGIRAATSGKGVDVVLNSLTGDLMHASWDCLAAFGRFIEVGKRELVDAGKLNMDVFLRNATFTAFDLTDLYYSDCAYHKDILVNTMKKVLELYRSGEIEAPPTTTFDVGDIVQAYRYFSTPDRIGKVVISLENTKAVIPVSPPEYSTIFHADKTYLLVGCLGGLGRSLSRWMLSRGARRFVFLGRSGCDKPSARELVELLRRSGAHVTVFRGDVSEAAHVQDAVSLCHASGYSIGGVVQAAMGLHEALFYQMTSEAWHTGIQPKWAGTWNLHNALEGFDTKLDFFLCMSSISGSVGTATESNYCSANGFLDSFAKWRQQQGKPAVSVGLGMISEVGYLHENPDIEALLLRKGIQPLNEQEFLQIIDLCITQPHRGPNTCFDGNSTTAHVLTGLELNKLRNLVNEGFDISGVTEHDPRSSLLASSLELGHNILVGAGTELGLKSNTNAAAWYHAASANMKKTFQAEADQPTLYEAILQMIRKRFCNVLLMKMSQIDDYKPLLQFGIDSMIAAELRAWIWGAFAVDVPFLDLLSPVKSLSDLSKFLKLKINI